jgi:hypothetical protein
MPTKLNKPVTRAVDVSLRPTEYRRGLVARMGPEGVFVKSPGGRWSKALLATWGDIVLVAAERRAEELKRERAERKRLARL